MSQDMELYAPEFALEEINKCKADIIKKNIKPYPLSKLLEEQEEQFKIWDQMKTIKELFATLCEKKISGFITKKEMDDLVAKYIATFEDPSDRIKMSDILDFMIQNGEETKAVERIKKRDSYGIKQREKEYGIQEVN